MVDLLVKARDKQTGQPLKVHQIVAQASTCWVVSCVGGRLEAGPAVDPCVWCQRTELVFTGYRVLALPSYGHLSCNTSCQQ